MDQIILILCSIMILRIAADILIGWPLRRRVEANLSTSGAGLITWLAVYGVIRTVLTALAIGALLALMFVLVFGGSLAPLGIHPDLATAKWMTGLIWSVRLQLEQIEPFWAWMVFALLLIAATVISAKRARTQLRAASLAALELELAARSRADAAAAGAQATGQTTPAGQIGTISLEALLTSEPRWRREFTYLRADQLDATAEAIIKQIRSAHAEFSPPTDAPKEVVERVRDATVTFVRTPSYENLVRTGLLTSFDVEGAKVGKVNIVSELSRLRAVARGLRRGCDQPDREDGGYAIVPQSQILRPRRPGLLSAMGRLMTSQGGFDLVRSGSRTMAQVWLVVFTPSVLALQSPMLSPAVAGMYARAVDFQVMLSEAALKEAWANYTAPAQQPAVEPQTGADGARISTSPPLQLSDERAAAELARAYEVGLRGAVAHVVPHAISPTAALRPSRS
jgi:hypothetical protein